MKKLSKLLPILPIVALSATIAPLTSCYASAEDFETVLNINLNTSFNFDSLSESKCDSGLSLVLDKTSSKTHITSDIKPNELESWGIISDSTLLKDSLTFSQDGQKLCFDGWLAEGTYKFSVIAKYKDFSEDPKKGKTITGTSQELTVIVGPATSDTLRIDAPTQLNGYWKEAGDSGDDTISVIYNGEDDVTNKEEDVTENAKLSFRMAETSEVDITEFLYFDEQYHICWTNKMPVGTHQFQILAEAKDDSYKWIQTMSGVITLDITGPHLESDELDFTQTINVPRYESTPGGFHFSVHLYWDVVCNGKKICENVTGSNLTFLEIEEDNEWKNYSHIDYTPMMYWVFTVSTPNEQAKDRPLTFDFLYTHDDGDSCLIKLPLKVHPMR